MKHIKLILIVIIVMFVLAASVLIFAGLKQPDRIDLPLSDLVQTDPVRFEALKSVKC